MRNKLYALIFSCLILSCQSARLEKILIPRTINANEDFNSYVENKEHALAVVKYADESAQNTSKDVKETFAIKLGDTLLRIQPDQKDKNFFIDKFASADFVNTQKTAVLVEAADNSGLVGPIYLITLKNNKAEVVSLYRASTGANDSQFTKGIIRVGSSGYLVNNDFFVTNVNAKVYVIPRQQPQERIQGSFFLKSPDKTTFVFLVRGAFYQVNYPTGDVYTEPLPKTAPKDAVNVYKWVQENYAWVKNAKGTSFFKQIDQNKVIDMRQSY
ncbi:MAG: hypothetical protein JWQ28_2709 [Pedobacter sp.]|jgi:hypothetical protein|nr:hypothetical protein [Pedobacter sp.]